MTSHCKCLPREDIEGLHKLVSALNDMATEVMSLNTSFTSMEPNHKSTYASLMTAQESTVSLPTPMVLFLSPTTHVQIREDGDTIPWTMDTLFQWSIKVIGEDVDGFPTADVVSMMHAVGSYAMKRLTLRLRRLRALELFRQLSFVATGVSEKFIRCSVMIAKLQQVACLDRHAISEQRFVDYYKTCPIVQQLMADVRYHATLVLRYLVMLRESAPKTNWRQSIERCWHAFRLCGTSVHEVVIPASNEVVPLTHLIDLSLDDLLRFANHSKFLSRMRDSAAVSRLSSSQRKAVCAGTVKHLCEHILMQVKLSCYHVSLVSCFGSLEDAHNAIRPAVLGCIVGQYQVVTVPRHFRTTVSQDGKIAKVSTIVDKCTVQLWRSKLRLQ